MHVPTEWDALAVRIAPPPRNVAFPRTWTVSVFTVEPSQVNNPVPVGFCGENGPDDTIAEPVLTLLPFACESDTLTESLRVMSAGLPIGWHTTWIGTETKRRFVTRIGVPTVNVSCGVVAPAVEAIANTAALHARTARMTPDRTLRFMGLDPSDSTVMVATTVTSHRKKGHGTVDGFWDPDGVTILAPRSWTPSAERQFHARRRRTAEASLIAGRNLWGAVISLGPGADLERVGHHREHGVLPGDKGDLHQLTG